MVAVRQDGDVASFRIHLQPKASRASIVGEVDGILRLRVTAPPVDGRANEACIRLLAKALDLPASRLRIAVGEHARVKLIQIAGASADRIRTTLCDVLKPPHHASSTAVRPNNPE